MNALFLTVTFLVVTLKVHLNLPTVPCFACFLSFLFFDTVRSTNDSLKQTTGMLLVCSSFLWFNQLSRLELVQHEHRPQHVFYSRNFDSWSEVQNFLKPSRVSQLERTMLSFSLASNTSNALEYSSQC